MPERLKNLSRMNLRARRGLVVYGDVVYLPGGTCGPRVQQDYQLIVAYRGTIRARIDARERVIEPGQALLVHPGHREFWRFDPEQETHHYWCAVSPRALPASLRRRLRQIRQTHTWTPHLERLLQWGLACGASPVADTGLDEQRALYLALHLMAEYAAECGRQQGSRADHRLEQMRAAISNEYRQPLRLGDLARRAGLSPQHLLRLCRERGEASPLQQLYQARLENASDLLLHTGLSIKEIAERSGFANPFHFSRRFRMWSGMAPRDYRTRGSGLGGDKGKGRMG